MVAVLGIVVVGVLVPQSAVLGHSGGTDEYGCHAGSRPYHCHGGGYSGGGSSSWSSSPREKRQALAASRRDNQVVSQRVIGEGWGAGGKYLVLLITYASGRTVQKLFLATATSVPSPTGGSSPQPSTTTTTTTTTTTVAPYVPPQILGINLGRDYDRESRSGITGTGRYMSQIVELRIKVDPRKLPLKLCWDVTANGANLHPWSWRLLLWTYHKDEFPECYQTEDRWDWGQRPSSDGFLTAEIEIHYRGDWYHPVPYVPRTFSVSATLTDVDGSSVSSELLTFVK